MLLAARSLPAPAVARPVCPHITRLMLFGAPGPTTAGEFCSCQDVMGRVRTDLLTGYSHEPLPTRRLYTGVTSTATSRCLARSGLIKKRDKLAGFPPVLGKDLTNPPVLLETKCSEGPAVSRKRLHIAWTHVSDQYPDKLPKGVSQMHEADLVYEDGRPKLANRRLILDSRDLPFRCTLETQNFRVPDEKELTFSAYGHQGTDVCGVELATKKVINYSNAPDQYDELENFPLHHRGCDREKGEGAAVRGHLKLLTAAARWSG